MWRKQMYQRCPNPEVGEIVVIKNEKSNRINTYRALTSDGYKTV